LGVPLEYTWWPQRRGFIRNTLNAGKCDAVMGITTGYDMISTTRPYYRSTYVFLSREKDRLGVQSLDDPKLREVKIGVHLIGDDYTNTPGAHSLAKRHIIDNVVGFSIYGDYSKPNPPAELVQAVADGRIDIAIIWGPFAGYFGRRQPVPMTLVPVTPVFDPPAQPYVYSISMGVERGNYALRKRLSEIIEKRRNDIEAILDEYGVPRVDAKPNTQPAR
jgi:mxaJ protein